MYVYEGAEDSYLLSEVLKQRKCRRFLDMGCGNGIQAMSVLDAGEIVCADINPEAVETARMSIKSENVDFVVSDLFRNISGKFDLIAFNTPYLDDSAPRDVSWTHMQGGKDVIRRFIKESKQFLEEDGCIVMLISNRGYGEYKKLAEETGFTWSVLREKGLFFERLFVVELRMRPERDV